MDKKLRIELGRVWLTAEEAAALDVGDVVEMDVAVDGTVEVFDGNRLVGRGRAAAMGGKLCVKIGDAAAGRAASAAAEGVAAARMRRPLETVMP
jgi:flagellar motor switch protein FliM